MVMNDGQLISVDNQTIPDCKGSLAARFTLDFSVAADFDIDLQTLQSLGRFDSCQTIYIDNRTGANVELESVVGGFHVTAKANTQGFYNVIFPNPIKVHVASPGGGGVTNIYFINVAIPGIVWPTV